MGIISKIRQALSKNGLDGLLVSANSNISYIIGYPSRDALLLISRKELVYFIDSRYTEEMKQYLSPDITLKEINGSLYKTVSEVLTESGLRSVGFEEKHTSFSWQRKLALEAGKEIKFIPVQSIIEDLRMVKTPREIEQIKKCAQITRQAFTYIEAYLTPGIRELEIAGELERFIRYQGAAKASFDCIIASGANSAYPHHLTSSRRLTHDDLVLIDMGADCAGYKSDLTRVFFLGKIKSLAAKIFDIVSTAKNKAISKIKPGARCSTIDQAARSFIAAKGYGRYFGHNLGHGVGLDIHEAPQISQREDLPLLPGMVFTVEPAIYLPGKFGIRLEDMVVVTEKGCEVLNGVIN